MPIIPLTGAWTLRARDSDERVPATIPGDVHSALLAAGRIPDPYDRANEDAVQWIGERDWILAREFVLDAAAAAAPLIRLVCEGVDTFADVEVNGVPVGTTDNQHRRWVFDLRGTAKAGPNRIVFRFRSPVAEAAARHARLPYPVPYSEVCNKLPNINLIRKTQCHAGWDWGPALMVSGIYGDIRIEHAQRALIDYVHVDQRHHDGRCDLEVVIEAQAVGGEARATVGIDGREESVVARLAPGRNVLRIPVRIDRPQLWWPRGHGEPHLYPLRVELDGELVAKSIGLRTVELVTVPDERGTSMTLRINGADIFCKGANWIPCDALPSRQTDAVVEDLLESAAEANMNMIRLWGGGQFESTRFYELCDRLGLMIWHDMMFACSLYPATDDFLESVRAEVAHQVLRLRDHAAIVLWCGDNELINNWKLHPETRDQPLRYAIHWDRLNHGVLRATLAKLDPSRPFWPSSPCSGPGDFSDGWHEDSKGDTHYWDVWHGGKPFEAYYTVRPRFCSEFGYQSFPSLPTVRTFARDCDLNVTSPVMEHHQRNADGNRKIVDMFTRYFRFPDGFENILWLSQLQQALAIKAGVEFWRSLQPGCMGTIYWQLNDNWPVASWSSLEYGGRWKQLHHHARRFFAPQIALALQRGDELELWAVNDSRAERRTILTVEVLALTGEIVDRLRFALALPAGRSTKVHEARVAELAGADRAQRLLRIVLADAEDGAVLHENTHLFAEPKRYELPKARIQATVEEVGDRAFDVTLRSDRLALFATVDTSRIAGRFSDNSLLLMPGAARTVRFSAHEATTAAALLRDLALKHLRDTYASAEVPSEAAAAAQVSRAAV